MSFRPLIRGFFFYYSKHQAKGYTHSVSVPFIQGFFFYSGNDLNDLKEIETCFRPLIRGFFFYPLISSLLIVGRFNVSVPSFGDSFFIINNEDINGTVSRFRPLIRGFFFYLKKDNSFVVTALDVSVPSFGDSFFIQSRMYRYYKRGYWFPSPHSGILFL